jgi:hypothetical protein
MIITIIIRMKEGKRKMGKSDDEGRDLKGVDLPNFEVISGSEAPIVYVAYMKHLLCRLPSSSARSAHKLQV